MSNQQSNQPGDEDEGYWGILFPVLVTVETPLDTINQLIRRSDNFLFESRMNEGSDLYVISDEDMRHPSKRQAWPLPASFESPFIGKTVAELAETFRSKLAKRDEPEDRFSDFTFGIIDEQTLRDSTLLAVSILDRELELCRIDIEIAAITMVGPEVTGNNLNEGSEPEADGQYYERLTDELRRHYLEHDDEDDE